MRQTRLTQIYVYAMLTLFLFFTGFHGYTAIFDAKCTVFTALSLVYIAGILILGVSKRRATVSEVCALAYLFFTLLSALSSRYFPRTLLGVSRFEGAFTIGIYVFVFIFTSRHWQWKDSFIPFVSIVMTVQSVVVLLQLMGFNALWLYPQGTDYYIAIERYNGAFISTVGNADIASAFFSLMTPVLWALFFGCKKYRPITLISAILSLICLMLMSVTAGVVAMIVTLFAFLFILLPWKFAIITTGVTVAVFLLLVGLLPFKSGTLLELQLLLKGELDGDFGSGRIHIWQEVLSKVKDNLWLGTGPDTMLLEDIEPFTKIIDGKTVTRRIDIAHNDYLNVLFHQGVFALTSYVGIVLSSLWKWYKNGTKSIAVTALGLGVFAYACHMLFSFSACTSAIFFWIMLGMLNSQTRELQP